MKRTIIMLIFIALVAMLAAQLTVDIPFSTNLVGPEPHGTENWTSEYFHITNTGATGTYSVVLVPENLPEGWMCTWCNEGLSNVPDGCHPYSAPAWEITFLSGETLSLDFQAIYSTSGAFDFSYVIDSADLAAPLVLPFNFRTEDYDSIDEDIIPGFRPALNGNFPNPFNPETTISFALTKELAINAKLSIYNINGKLVKSFTNLTTTNDRGTVVWHGMDNNGKSCASGVYYYQLSSGNFLETRKMILIK
ncbi:MAG: T9SS type A sorting domain-containing protein [Candidatus Cloacimonetes bacterium]|nr:T9SS type A sorting domain-containing protein [Candidatus Cloacimonadota bacterium]